MWTRAKVGGQGGTGLARIRRFLERLPRRVPAAELKVERPARLDPRASGDDLPAEIGGYDGPEPTRFGDWEHQGRCTDF